MTKQPVTTLRGRREGWILEIYRFETTWQVRAPLERVWETVIEAERWPQWGKGFRRVEVVGPGSRLTPDATAVVEVRGALPYTLGFTFRVERFERPRLITLRAEGDLVGTGSWRLEPTDGGSLATYLWEVGLTNRFLDLVGQLPLAKRILAWNHDRVMEDAYQGFRTEVENPGPS